MNRTEDGMRRRVEPSEAEWRQSSVEWDETQADYPQHQCIQELVEAQVKLTPDAVAVMFEERRLTYSELNIRANQLAHYLRKRGVGPGTLVGIYLERSMEMVVGVLGVLKAGGTYVPLDPEYPRARLAYMIEDTGARLLLTQERLLKNSLDYVGEVLCLNRDHRLFEGEEEANPEVVTGPEDLAYVVYTSGSTGKPKGVLSSHQGVVNYLTFIIKNYDLKSSDIVLQIASLSFDASVRDLIGPLTAGARVVVVNPGDAKEPTALLSKIKQHGVTCLLSVVPTRLSGFIQTACAEDVPYDSIRLILVSGEALQLSACRKVKEVFGPRVLIVNQYGPTECTMTSTYYPVHTDQNDQGIALIGRPIPNCRIHILDSKLNAVPSGATGELHIGGVGLALGYLNRADLTGEKFIPNPFSDKPGARLYKTGDVARCLPDGNIQFLGRSDRQVKIAGIRIELGEIESMLLRHSSIKACAVVVRNAPQAQRNLIAKEGAQQTNTNGGEMTRLVAYVVHRNKMANSELRKYLEKDLPLYMVPGQFVELDALPLNANGKVNIAALPEPNTLRPELAEAFVAPRNSIESLIAGVWQEVLPVDRVGVNDGFFELGGDSLLAIQALNRLRQLTEVNVSFRDLFETKTVARLARLIQQVQKTPTLSSPERAVIRKASYPLSLAQQGIWFLWKMEPNSPYYISQGVVQLHGRLNLPVFERAWQALLERHEILRVRFGVEAGNPIQMFRAGQVFDLSITDLSSLPETERHRTVRRLAQEEIEHPFDLERDPLLRFRLFKLSDNEHHMLLTMHEITVDLWSVRIMLHDLGVLYNGFSKGEVSPLPSLKVQLSDFVLWESAHVNRTSLRGQEGYWRKKLSGELPVLDLPLDRPRPISPSYRGKSRSVLLDPELSKQLNSLSRQENATLFMTLLSAFSVLLQVYTGQEDVIVGAPLANRTNKDAEQIVGFWLNMLPLRMDLADGPSFVELLRRVRETAAEAITNADYPFMWMLEWVKAVRDTGFSPVFQVMFNMLSFPDVSLKSEDLEITYRGLETGNTKYDLSLYAQEHGDQIHLQLSYLSDLFDESTIDRMLNNLVVVLNSIVKDPESPISALRTLDEAEEQALLNDFNNTRVAYEMDESIHQMFERQAEKTPYDTAMIFDGQRLSYAELNARANQLAHYLRWLGVGPQTYVGICVERSLQTIIGLLGVMKAGGVYIALDPDYPLLRLYDILKDTSPPVMLVERKSDRFDDYAGRKVYLDDDQNTIAKEDTSNPICLSMPENLLNVVYTSSSTGKPKGTLITIGSVLNRLFWMWDAYPFRAGDVAVLQKSYALVAATWECFGALLRGVPTVILSRRDLLDPVELWRTLVRNEVSYLLGSPALLQGILDQGELRPGEWHTLRLATTSAEPISPAMVARWIRVFPGVPLLNLYGSTECASNVTVYDVRQMASEVKRVPVGTPLPNTQVYVLSGHLKPVPIGVTGEMCVAGACVARGYLNLPDLTARRFVPNPYSGEAGSRLYRTGDLARYTADGNIELIGRKDHQVKIRGFRVEPADIEAALLRHEMVSKCTVILRDDDGRERLVAYVVAEKDLSISELRRYLRERLPDYMVPADFVQLGLLPLTPSGKIDRAALPAPDESRPELEVAYMPPRNPVETTTASIWCEALGLDQVGIHDNFFDLGGHSLMATQVIMQVNKTWNVDIPLRALFESPTVAGLSALIVQSPLRRESSRQTHTGSIPGVVSAAPPEGDAGEYPPAFMKIDRRPLLSLFAIGEIAPVVSASVGCMPSQLVHEAGFAREEIIYEWCNDLPTLIAVTETSLGRIARIKLPRLNTELFHEREELLGSIMAALQLAKRLGARTVSLTGLIPSATDYGVAVVRTMSDGKDLPRISTGHATTVTAVMMATRRIVEAGGRDLSQERVGFLGLGSIGGTALRLMLRCLPHPAEITLCDVYSKRESLEQTRQELHGEFGFQGAVRILESQAEIPAEFYDATLMIGATNVPDILDIRRVSSGTMIIDDSSPHCFSVRDTVRRFREQEDVLFTEGGVLQSPEPISQLSYLPRTVGRMMNLAHMAPFSKYNPFQITSCVLSGLLSSCYEDLKPTVGVVDVVSCLQNYDRLGQLGFQAADLHCGDYVLPEKSIQNFRRRFGES